MPRPTLLNRLTSVSRFWLEKFRMRLAHVDAMLPLSILGLAAGLLAGITIIALRLLVDGLQVGILPLDAAENFEALPAVWRLGSAVAGGVLIGALFRITREDSHTVGVLHVLVRLAHHQGSLPWRNALVQFVGGAIAMVSGQSVGREGPSAHLGAASSNLPAQALHLPNNSLRILAACGAAAGIAASFNTPLAGAAFAMEVLLMEYTVAGFAPVILATVSATALSRAVFGDDLAYLVPTISLGSLAELPYILLCGVLIGTLSAGFTLLYLRVTVQAQRLPVWLRPMLAGLLVGLCGVAVPEVMGIGDDTVSNMLLGEYGILLLLLLLLAKLGASTAIALGLPGGVIGPILFIGAAAGGVLGGVGGMLGVNGADEISLYVLIGMGAMMAGTMMAPMAGLIAILELTGEPGILLPAMLAVVAATIVSGRLSKRESLFHGILSARGLSYRNDPLVQSLRRIGVTSVMDRRVVELDRVVAVADIDSALAEHPLWILVREQGRQAFLLAAVDLLRAHKESSPQQSIDLLELPGERLQTYPIDTGATLEQAWDRFHDTGGRVLYVVNQSVPGLSRVYGVLTLEQIESSYRYGA